MSLVTRLLPDNPVLTKELRVRMRGARAYWILFGYLGFLSLVLLFQYGSWISNVQTSGGSEVSRLGGEIFTWIMVTQIFLVLFITPAITSGSITIEHEQRTMDLLMLTRISRRSIITGKLFSAVSFTALLLISSLPLISICFMLGSVDPAMVFSAYMMMLMGSFLIGAMGLMWSSVARTTTQAVMYTYASLFLLFCIGALALGFTINPFRSGNLVENIVMAFSATWFSDTFMGIKGPMGIGFSIFCLLCGWLFAAIAMARMEMFPERKALLLRVLALLMVGIELLAINLWWLNAWYNKGAGAVMTVVQPPIAALILTALALMALVPTFATGDLLPVEARRFGRYLVWGWTPRGLSRGKMASGLPYLVGLTVISLLLFAVSFVLVGKSGDILKASAGAAAPIAQAAPVNPAAPTVTAFGQPATIVNGQAVPLPPGAKPVPAVLAPPPGSAGDFPQAALMLLVTVVGFSLFCMFLSIAFRNRWVAWILAYVILLVIFIGPELSHIPAYGGGTAGVGVNLYYFNPVQAIAQMADPANYYNNELMSQGMLLLGKTPMWLGVTWAWGVTGILSVMLMLPFIVRAKRATAAIPYEEMVATY